jgi:S-adenosylmethionine hydrolase
MTTRALTALLLSSSLVTLAGCASAPSADAPAPPVVLLTDFGLHDDAVGLLRGVVLSIAPRSQVVDLTHEVPVFDVAAGARLLVDAPGVYPAGSVFVVVVDPGVGTPRRAIAARLANGSFLVGPDNGVLSTTLERYGPAEVRDVKDRGLMRGDVSTTFHGRDVFAPVGAHLAAGTAFEEVGPVITDWVRLALPQPVRGADGVLSGVVTAIDEPFGNVWTNIPGDWLRDVGLHAGDRVDVWLRDAPGTEQLQVTYVETFGDVPVGRPLLYVNSRGQAALALNMGDFARTHGVKGKETIRLRKAKG